MVVQPKDKDEDVSCEPIAAQTANLNEYKMTVQKAGYEYYQRLQ